MLLYLDNLWETRAFRLGLKWHLSMCSGGSCMHFKTKLRHHTETVLYVNMPSSQGKWYSFVLIAACGCDAKREGFWHVFTISLRNQGNVVLRFGNEPVGQCPPLCNAVWNIFPKIRRRKITVYRLGVTCVTAIAFRILLCFQQKVFFTVIDIISCKYKRLYAKPYQRWHCL